ncbi:MAG TPA: glycosyltransferase family 9 protein [Bryobacteraceae bacterium]|nr:glycosyltransferase family 9 protein [Bryobacteraceae bacterium]
MRRLVIRPGAIGDFILSLPAIDRLRTGYFEIWARGPNVPLARCAERTRAIEATGLDLLGITGPDPWFIDELRSFDSIVSWYGANRPEFRELTASLDLPFIFLPALPPVGTGVHAVDFYLEQVRTLACRSSDGVPRIPCPAAPGNFAVLHPFAASEGKRWPLERFRELAGVLERRMPVRWCAGPEDELPGAIRIPDLYELACVLASARVFIGNDSGISHLAAAAGAPVVALFGPTDPAVWAPRGPHVRVVAKTSMEAIEIEEVLAAIA